MFVIAVTDAMSFGTVRRSTSLLRRRTLSCITDASLFESEVLHGSIIVAERGLYSDLGSLSSGSTTLEGSSWQRLAAAARSISDPAKPDRRFGPLPLLLPLSLAAFLRDCLVVFRTFVGGDSSCWLWSSWTEGSGEIRSAMLCDRSVMSGMNEDRNVLLWMIDPSGMLSGGWGLDGDDS